MSLITNIPNTSISFKTGRAFALKEPVSWFWRLHNYNAVWRELEYERGRGRQKKKKKSFLERRKGDVRLYLINILWMSPGFWKISQMTEWLCFETHDLMIWENYLFGKIQVVYFSKLALVCGMIISGAWCAFQGMASQLCCYSGWGWGSEFGSVAPS